MNLYNLLTGHKKSATDTTQYQRAETNDMWDYVRCTLVEGSTKPEQIVHYINGMPIAGRMVWKNVALEFPFSIDIHTRPILIFRNVLISDTEVLLRVFALDTYKNRFNTYWCTFDVSMELSEWEEQRNGVREGKRCVNVIGPLEYTKPLMES